MDLKASWQRDRFLILIIDRVIGVERSSRILMSGAQTLKFHDTIVIRGARHCCKG